LRILFLTPEVPHPTRGGGTIKSSTVLEYLQARHDVDLMCLRDADPVVRGRTPGNILRSYAAGVPLSVLRNRSQPFVDLVRDRATGGGFDALLCDGWLMAQYLPSGFAGLRVLHQHNAEFVMWEREATLESNPLRRAIVRWEAARVRRYEASILQPFDVTLAVSKPDRQALRGLAGSKRIELLANVAEPGLLERPPLPALGTDPVILYLGTLSWPPNARGLRNFIRRTFPLLRARRQDVRLVVAGRGAPPDLAGLVRGPGIEMAGAVDDPEPLYRRARVFVEVAAGGSGTRVKVLNALARGLPVVTTPDGAEGLDVLPGEHVLIGSSPEELVDALVRVMDDDGVWSTLSENGRRLIRDRYTPETAYRVLDEVFAPDPS
jgi:glycosyltransferase involved in cell wall biosynthesis